MARSPINPRHLRVISVVLGLVAIALLVWALFGGDGGASRVSYPNFLEMLDSGRVASATIAPDEVTFTLTGDETTYRTDNPAAPDFRERLLMAGVEVSDAASAGDVFNLLLDILFYGIIIGGGVFALWKAISVSRSTFKVVHSGGVRLADVAGMDQLKRELLYAVEVLNDPKKRTAKGIRQVKGIVLEGPPGNGKTLLARALATETDVAFIATKGADFQSAFMSLGARKIRMLFAKARRHAPCIVFIDEFDSIGERRNYAGTGIDKENNRIITAMLNEMDGFTPSDGVLVIAATNSYRSLDPALVRPGRFDLKFTVGNPDHATRMQLVAMYARGKTLATGLTSNALADATEGLSCAAIETLLNEAAALADMEGAPSISATHLKRAADKVGVQLVGSPAGTL